MEGKEILSADSLLFYFKKKRDKTLKWMKQNDKIGRCEW